MKLFIYIEGKLIAQVNEIERAEGKLKITIERAYFVDFISQINDNLGALLTLDLDTGVSVDKRAGRHDYKLKGYSIKETAITMPAEVILNIS